MASTFTPNLNLELQGVGDNVGTWGTVLNTAALAVLDTVLGGIQTFSLSNVNVNVTTTQSQNNFIKLTGTLTGNVIITFPAIGRTYWIWNATTGSFSVTIARSGGAATVVIPQGYKGLFALTSDGVIDLSVLAVTSGTATAITITNSTIVLKQATDPTPTAEGDIQWSTLFNHLKVGDGSGTQRFLPGPAPGALVGCSLANNVSDPTNDIDFASGVATDSTYSFYMTAGALTKKLDVAWAAGNAQGGLFSGVVANGTYYCFIIMNPTTGVVDAGFDTSLIAANRPVGYTYFRRVGAIVRASAAIKSFTQTGNLFRWNAAVSDYASTASTSGANVTLTVPLGLILEAQLSFAVLVSGGNFNFNYYRLSPLTETNAAASATNFTLASSKDNSTNAAVATEVSVPTDTSGQIRQRGTTAHTLAILTNGWIDNRGING